MHFTDMSKDYPSLFFLIEFIIIGLKRNKLHQMEKYGSRIVSIFLNDKNESYKIMTFH